MRRKNISFKKHARKFNKARNKTRAINNAQIMRGGFRL